MDSINFIEWALFQGVAMDLIGVPYEFGAKPDYTGSVRPNKLDCSGFVKYCYALIGIEVPDGSNNQYLASVPVALPQIGDVGFFLNDGVTHHVGMLYDATSVIEACTNNHSFIVPGYPTNQVMIRPRHNWEEWPEFSGWRRFKAVMM